MKRTHAFCLALSVALGGFFLLSFHAKKQRLPSAMVVGHALIAVAGFLTLLLAEFALIS